MRETLESYCRNMDRMELMDQWDTQRNLPLTPGTISYGSKRKVWWHCIKGHHWQAAVHTRTNSGASCPVCMGKVPSPGETDLATLYPELAHQWHPSKNGTLTPAQVLPGSHKLVWWICEKGHVWRAQIKSRVAGCGCPICANRMIIPEENDLATRFPDIAAQWHPTRNGSLVPSAVAAGSHRKVWWYCEKGHAWQASIASRTSAGCGCPICTGRKVLPGENDLASRFPDIAAQWHPTRNGPLHPDQVTPCSNRKVWWYCDLGHAYQATVSARISGGSGCPYCTGRKVLLGFNDLATTEPLVAKQWHPTLNNSLTPEMVTAGSHRKVWWICNQGHVWQAVIHSRTGAQRVGCPVCAGRINQSRLERYQKILKQPPIPGNPLNTNNREN